MTKPIPDKIRWLRQRQRLDGSWRIWWEPTADARVHGFDVVELDANRLTWSTREARRLNDEVDQHRAGTPTSRPAHRGRAIDDLIGEYLRSTAFLRLAAKTQGSYRNSLRRIARKWGTKPVKDFTKPVMFAWYETLFENAGHYEAKALLTQMSILFSFAERIGWRADNSNPCLRLGMATPKGRGRTASWSELDALTTAADALGMPAIGLAVRLSAFQGQRQTTVRSACRGDFRQITLPADGDAPQETVWIWTFMRSKRQNEGVTQLHPEVVPAVEAALARPGDPADPLLIDHATGRGYSDDLLQKRWQTVRAAAAEDLPALTQLQFRDLRRTFGLWSRAGGASKDDTADVLGNSAAADPSLAEIYMAPQFHTTRRAVLAIRRPEDPKRKKA